MADHSAKAEVLHLSIAIASRLATGNWQLATGNWQQTTDNRQQTTDNRQQTIASGQIQATLKPLDDFFQLALVGN
ncbi:MAG: hypothetical protein ACYCYL_06355 [Acidithiobacillus sp.]